MARLDANGNLDTTVYNFNDEVFALALDKENRVLVEGIFTLIGINNGKNFKRFYSAMRALKPLR